MKKIVQLLTVLLVTSFTMNAQWMNDSISMGPNYANNIYYTFGGSGIQKTEPSNNWHLAFTMSALADSAAVFANHQSGNEFVKVFNIHQPISAWSSVTLSDTMSGDRMLAPYKGWYDGTFNQISHPSAFNYGWGTYKFSSHDIIGDSMFIVRVGTDYYKFAIDSLQKFGDAVQSYSVSKGNGFNDRLFAYFDITSGQSLDREPNVNDWDVEFITYPSYIPAGPGVGWYAVTGVLNNRGLGVAEARQFDLDDAKNDFDGGSASWANDWKKNNITTIGYDWKRFNSTSMTFAIADSLSYFIESKSGKVYQVQFTDFGGFMTGKANFRYREVSTPLSVAKTDFIGEPSLYPNPAQNSTTVLFKSVKASELRLTITGLTGQVLHQSLRKATSGLNAWELDTSSLPSGNYVISLSNSEGATHQKMTITK
jgi:hypothetical protein